MIVDASALVAILRDEPGAPRFADALAVRTQAKRLSAANYLEAAIVIDGSRDPIASRRLDDVIAKVNIKIESVTEERAKIARGLSGPRQRQRPSGRAKHGRLLWLRPRQGNRRRSPQQADGARNNDARRAAINFPTYEMHDGFYRSLWHGSNSSRFSPRNTARKVGRKSRAALKPKPLRCFSLPASSSENVPSATVGSMRNNRGAVSEWPRRIFAVPRAAEDCPSENRDMIPLFIVDQPAAAGTSRGTLEQPRLSILVSAGCHPNTPTASTAASPAGLFAQTPPSTR